MNENDIIAEFIRDVKQIFVVNPDQEANLEVVAERMQKLVADPIRRNWQEELPGNVHSGQQSGIVYQDESGLALMHASFALKP